MIKKILLAVLALITAVLFAGCGVYTPPTGSNRPSSGNGSGDNGGGGNPSEGENGFAFTVTLKNAPAEMPEDIEAVWTGNNEVFSSKFTQGVAKAEGLNGEYHVTLSRLPEGYTYDCNGYEADNDNRDIQIELLEIIPLKEYIRLAPNGESTITWYTISQYGTYRATIKSAADGDAVGFMFEPKENGSFSITSWCDVTANQINPVLRIYGGTKVFCHFTQEITDGGSSGTYTKNFRYSADFGDENLGAVQLFTVKASVNGIDYPVNVDFTLKRESDFELEDTRGEPYYATGPFYSGASSGSWRYIYEDNTSVSGGVTYYVQDEDKVVFNTTDKFYHVGRADGPLLYARLTKDLMVFITATVPGGAWVNQGFFWNELANGMVNLNVEGRNYSYMINNGYAKYCDSNGAHPVTEEIKTFLQGYASREGYFKDGEGWAEDPEQNANDFTNPSGINLQSDENSMWMFACGYYR